MTNETQGLRLLVIEDKEQHLTEARRVLDEFITRGVPINVTYASRLQEAMENMRTSNVEAIISDVFFPENNECTSSEEARTACTKIIGGAGVEIDELQYYEQQAVRDWQAGMTQAPLGVIVADEAMSRGLPIVFCSDMHHHTYASEPINGYAYRKRIEYIDPTGKLLGDDKKRNEHESKDFTSAYLDVAYLAFCKERGFITVTPEKACVFGNDELSDKMSSARYRISELNRRDSETIECVKRDYAPVCGLIQEFMATFAGVELNLE